MAAAPFEDRLIDLLIQWEESRRQGPDLRPEDLCSDCPELVEELRHRIEAVRAMGPVIGAETMARRRHPGTPNAEMERRITLCLMSCGPRRFTGPNTVTPVAARG